MMLQRPHSPVRRYLPWVIADALSAAFGFSTALALRYLDAPAGRELALDLAQLERWLLPVMVVFALVNVIWGLDRRIWRFATAYEVVAISMATATSGLAVVASDIVAGIGGTRPLSLSVVLMGSVLTFGLMVAVRYRTRLMTGLFQYQERRGAELTRTLIYGTGDSAQVLAWRLLNQMEGRAYRLVGLLADDNTGPGLRIHGIRVLGGRDDLAQIVARERIELVILAPSDTSGEHLRELLTACQTTDAQIKIFPGLSDIMAVAYDAPMSREIRVEDLLGREPVAIDEAVCEQVLRGQVVLVTGGCGSVGSELCRQTAAFTPEHLVILDNNESGLYDLEIDLRAQYPGLLMTFVVADVTDELKMERIFASYRPEVVFHAAAYKHVPLMQAHPEEAVRVNIRGTMIPLDMARRYGTGRFVLVSTDKAVNPGSVMGATKRLAELLVMDANGTGEGGADTLLCTAVRFGNVIGSRGSVVPTFTKQIDLGGPVTVTHPEMTRYFMDMREAACLIIQAAAITKGRDTLMLEMGERIKVDDLARKMIRMRGLRPDIDIPIIYTGVRPGEKLHEELTYAEEEVAKTSHPMVCRVIARGGTEARINRAAVVRLIEMAAHGNRDETVAELLRVARNPVDPLPVPGRSRPRVVSVTVDAAGEPIPDGDLLAEGFTPLSARD